MICRFYLQSFAFLPYIFVSMFHVPHLMHDSSIATFIPDDNLLNLIKAFSSTFEEAQQTVKTIHNAKFKAEQKADQKVKKE